MASSSKTPWASLSDKQKKKIAGITAGWQARRWTSSSDASAVDLPMKEVARRRRQADATSSQAHVGASVGEAQVHYRHGVGRVGAAFRQTQAGQRLNLLLLDKHRRAEEQLAGTGIVEDVDVDEQEALLLSYHAGRDILRERWRHRVLLAGKESMYTKIIYTRLEYGLQRHGRRGQLHDECWRSFRLG